MEEIRQALKTAVKELFDIEIEPKLTRPAEQFGDFSTNVAMQLAAKIAKPPREIAESLAAKIKKSKLAAKTEVAGPGFINIYLTDQAILGSLDQKPNRPHEGQTVVVEYSDPNPFKVLHVGHLYTSVVGDAIAKLFEAAGAKVARVNFGGDVGLHVAKTIWAILFYETGGNIEDVNTAWFKTKTYINKPLATRATWLANYYIQGNDAYERNDTPTAKTEIVRLNKQIYQIVEQKDHNSPLAQIYWTTRQWSYDYLDKFYTQIDTRFDKYYPESETVEQGLRAVKENIGKVFEESRGAIVFKGEVHNTHTRVFINKDGLPTYETKDVGLILKKWQDYHFDKSVIITGNDIYEYMQVVLKAIEQIAPELVKKTTHITHGMVKMSGGVKMSSHLGNIIRAQDVLEMVNEANQKLNNKKNADVTLAAVKYAFLKNRIGADMIFDPAESVILQGNSGPYLQYAYVRANSILQKADSRHQTVDREVNLEAGERSLARKLGEYSEVVETAVNELLPSHICTYLYELAQTFNRFYERNHVVGDPRQAIRLKLVESYAQVLKNGLELLNIPVLEKM